MGSWSDRIGGLLRRGRQLSSPPPSPEESLRQKLTILAPWFETLYPPELWQINICRLNHPGCDSLLWQSEHTKTAYKLGIVKDFRLPSSSCKWKQDCSSSVPWPDIWRVWCFFSTQLNVLWWMHFRIFLLPVWYSFFMNLNCFEHEYLFEINI